MGGYPGYYGTYTYYGCTKVPYICGRICQKPGIWDPCDICVLLVPQVSNVKVKFVMFISTFAIVYGG